MSESKAVIFGCAGSELSSGETSFFADTKPWGFILFGRNIVSLNQVAELTASLRESVGRPDAPVLIDQEGGRVQRFKPPLVPQYPSGADLGALYLASPEAGLRATWILSRLHAFDLLPLGINVDCLPVLDEPSPGGHEVIGSRAYGITPDVVSVLARAASEGLKAVLALHSVASVRSRTAGVISDKRLFDCVTVLLSYQVLLSLSCSLYLALISGLNPRPSTLNPKP